MFLKKQSKNFYSSAVLVFLAFLGFFLLLHFSSNNIIADDALYHIKHAYLLRTGWLEQFKNFPWLNFTIMNWSFSDFSFLYHVFLIPFTFGDLVLGIKISGALMSAALFTILFLILKNLNVKYSLLWLILLLFSTDFVFRLLLARPLTFAIILSLLVFYAAIKNKYLWLLLLGIINALSYGASIILTFIILVIFLLKILAEKKYDIKLLAYFGAGILIGFIIHPNFPNNLFINSLIDFYAFYPKHFSIAEMQPLNLFGIFKNSALLLMLFWGVLVILIYYKNKIKDLSNETKTATIFCLSFLILVSFAQRFVEYWVPFTILAGALVVRDLGIDKKLIDSIKKLYRAKGKMLLLPALALMLPVFLLFSKSIGENYYALRNTNPINRYQKSTEWLKNNTPEKSIVFNVSWDDFPELFYWNDKNYYIVGMDPTFMYEYDKNLYEKYSNIASGDDKNPSETIKKYFGTETVFVNKEKNPEFIKVANQDPGLEKSYEDSWSIIYRVK